MRRRCAATAGHGGRCKNIFTVTYPGRYTCATHAHLNSHFTEGKQERLPMDIPMISMEAVRRNADKFLPKMKQELENNKPEWRR